MLKLLHVVTQGCWVRIPTKIFEISSPKYILGQISAQKFKLITFIWKFLHIVSQTVLIQNLDIDFWNFEPNIHFWANLGPKIQSILRCLKIGAHSISRMLIPNLDSDFWNSDPKIAFGANLCPKIQSCAFCHNISAHSISRMLIPNPDLDFWNFNHKIHSWVSLSKKVENYPFCPENWCT